MTQPSISLDMLIAILHTTKKPKRLCWKKRNNSSFPKYPTTNTAKFAAAMAKPMNLIIRQTRNRHIPGLFRVEHPHQINRLQTIQIVSAAVQKDSRSVNDLRANAIKHSSAYKSRSIQNLGDVSTHLLLAAVQLPIHQNSQEHQPIDQAETKNLAANQPAIYRNGHQRMIQMRSKKTKSAAKQTVCTEWEAKFRKAQAPSNRQKNVSPHVVTDSPFASAGLRSPSMLTDSNAPDDDDIIPET